MALSSGYKKITRTQKQSDGNYKKISEWTSSTSVERDNGETIETSVSKLESDLSSLSKTVTNNKTSWGDKYTKNEIDNKFSTLETNIDWKESVATYSDIAKTYPNPADGWTVNVKDTDYTYRYNGTGWVAISANAIPKATTSVDGLLSKTDKAHYDDAYSKRHTHSNKSVIDGITSTLVNNWNSAKTHADSAHAPSDAQANVIETVKVNGTALTPSSKAVNVTVPTKVSQLTNDSGYKTTDTNTTYSLSKSGSTITLTGSDGKSTSVIDSNTTYSVATQSTNGLMSPTDKTKLDGIATYRTVKAKDRVIVCIGDSYGVGAGSDTNKGWCERLIKRIGCVGYYYVQSGSGFVKAVNNRNYLTMLDEAIKAISNKDSVTDIVFCGGINDIGYDIVDNFSTAYDTCKNNFPNAQMHVGMIEWYAGADNNIGGLLKVLSAYKTICARRPDVHYLNGVEHVLRGKKCFSKDGYHPNEYGYELITIHIMQALMYGSTKPIYAATGVTNTLSISNQTSLAINTYLLGDVQRFYMSEIKLDNLDNLLCDGTEYKFGKITDGILNGYYLTIETGAILASPSDGFTYGKCQLCFNNGEISMKFYAINKASDYWKTITYAHIPAIDTIVSNFNC